MDEKLHHLNINKPKHVDCLSCKKRIRSDASICDNCHLSQNLFLNRFHRLIPFAGIVLTVIALIPAIGGYVINVQAESAISDLKMQLNKNKTATESLSNEMQLSKDEFDSSQRLTNENLKTNKEKFDVLRAKQEEKLGELYETVKKFDSLLISITKNIIATKKSQIKELDKQFGRFRRFGDSISVPTGGEGIFGGLVIHHRCNKGVAERKQGSAIKWYIESDEKLVSSCVLLNRTREEIKQLESTLEGIEKL